MAKTAHITVRDEVYCHVAGLEPADHEFLENKFAIMVEGAFFMPAYKMGRWDGKIRFFEKTGKIYHRLLDELVPYLEGWGYEIDLQDLRKPVLPVTKRISSEWFLEKPGMELKVALRPYQVDAVNAALDATSGFIEAATGAGKTWMVAALADVLNQSGVRTMVIVPSSDLVEQTAATFELGLLDVGIYSGDTKDLHHMTVVATWQALQNNPRIVEDFGSVIVDEAHGATAKTIGELINVHGKDIPYRWGFTGTMPKPKIDLMTLRGAIGEVLYAITASDLMRMGYLADLEIEPIQIIDDSIDEEFPDYSSEKTFLSRSPARLDLIADLIISKAETYGNTLVLVNSIKQGKELQKLIKDSVFLEGATKGTVRAEWYSMFEDRDDLIVIATSGIASTGISIDRVFCLVMIDAGKSFIKCIQSIGRGLRKGRDKEKVHCVDIHSNLKWAMKHWRERLKYYKAALYNVVKVVKVKV
jgi:superfamily II DNA or RNA helicase